MKKGEGGLRMRRIAEMLAWALILLLALPVAGAAESEYQHIDVTANRDEVYMLRDNALWRLNGAYEPEAQICAYDVDVRGIFARDGEMYVAYRDGNAIHFARQAEDGALDELFAVDDEVDIYDFVVVGDAVAVTWYPREIDYDLDFVHRFSAFSMNGEKRDLGMDFAAAIAPCEDGRLLLANGNFDFWDVYAMDPQTGERQTIPVEEFCTIMALAGAPEELYVLDAAGVNRCNEDGTMDNLQMLDWPSFPGMVKTSDALLVFSTEWDEEEPAIQVRKLKVDSADTRTLTVDLQGNPGLQDSHMRRAIQKLQADNPNVNVEFITLTDEQRNTILMAGGDGADIVLVVSGIDKALIESGAFLDLNAYPELRQALEPLEYLLPLLTNDKGSLFGVPAYAMINKIYEFQQLKHLEPADFDIGNCTWMELLEAAMRFNGKFGVAFFMDVDTDFPTWLRQYIAAEGEELSFDTPLFRELAEAYRTALNAGRIQSSFGSDWENALYMLDSRESDSLYGDVLFPAPALEADRPARLVQMDAFAVNAHGNHPDLAVQLLQNYLDPEIVYADGGYDHMRLDEAEYVDMAQFTERERALIPENQAAYAQAIPPGGSYGFLVACQNWMPQYYAGDITLDELIAHLQREWDMRRLG